jgi:hypothetical protein
MPGDGLGSAVSYDGGYVAAGAPGSDLGASSSGAVVLYDLGSSTQPAATVANPAPEQDANFGSGVRMVGARLFASAPRQDPDGAVYAFVGGPLAWSLEDTVVHSNGGFPWTFGQDLVWEANGLGGDLWVSSSTDQVFGLPGAGAIHLFGYQPPIFPATEGNFVLTETIVSDTPTDGGRFGSGLAVDHPSFGVARVLTGSGIYDGHAYVFERSELGSNAFEIERKFQHPSLQTPLRSVALDGDVAVWGAHEAAVGAALTGGAVVLDLGCDPACGPRLANPDPSPGAATGQSVDVLGSMAVVGVPGDDTMGTDAGAVRVYRYDGACWNLETTLYDESPAPGDGFGHAVAISPFGNYLLIGAPRADGAFVDQGKVVVYFRSNGTPGWFQTTILAPPDPSPSFQGYFGFSLAVDGWTVVGAPGTSSSLGQVHVFDAPGGVAPTLQATLLSTNPTGDWFGYDVACAGGTVYVGNPLDDAAGTDAGAVSVHSYNPFVQGWFTWQHFQGPAVAGYRFGSAVDVDGARGVVGAPAADVAGQARAGRAYLYAMNGSPFGNQLDELVSPSLLQEEAFGSDVALLADRISIGAPAPGTGGTGAVYDFDRVGNATVLVHTLAPAALPAGAAFGSAVATNGKHTVVGAPAGLGGSAGSAWALAGETRGPDFTVDPANGGRTAPFGPPIL